nr:hypothetical protein CFP56_62159 [Quercus suber]
MERTGAAFSNLIPHDNHSILTLVVMRSSRGIPGSPMLATSCLDSTFYTLPCPHVPSFTECHNYHILNACDIGFAMTSSPFAIDTVADESRRTTMYDPRKCMFRCPRHERVAKFRMRQLDRQRNALARA